MIVCSTTIRLPFSDIRPPNSALASIGSTVRRGRNTGDAKRHKPKTKAAEGRDQHGAQRIERRHRAEPLVWADPEQRFVDKLRRRRHQPDHDAGGAAKERGQDHQPDFVGANQRAQHLRRMHDRGPDRAAGTPGCGRLLVELSIRRRTRVSPARRAPCGPAMVESPGSVGIRDVQPRKRGDRRVLGPDPAPRNNSSSDWGITVVKISLDAALLISTRGTFGLVGRLQIVLDERADHLQHRFVGGEAERAGVQRLERRRPGGNDGGDGFVRDPLHMR